MDSPHTQEKDTSANPSAQVSDKEKVRAGQEAIKKISQPIRKKLLVAEFLTVVSGILSIAPYVALVELGRLLLEPTIDHSKVRFVVIALISAYTTRIFLYFVALCLTHFIDLSLRNHMRRKIAERMSHAPLSWFSSMGEGRIRKIIQDDTATVHTVIAHGPIEKLNAIVSPISLFAYALYIDWRLALLAVSTIPFHLGMYGLTMRGMNEKTAQMDTKLSNVSAAMAEFVAGISVVKAFCKVGQAHKAYIDAANEFSKFYRAWCMPLVSMSVASFSWISIPVLLIVNLGGGALMFNAGWVTIYEVLTTTLIALVLPGAIITVVTIAWSYQLAGSAAVRLVKIMELPTIPQPSNPEIPTGNSIEITNVSYSYGSTHALKNINLTIPPQSVTALVGPSGAGKSTLASLIARFDDPATGSITIGGIDIRDISEEQLYSTVAFVLQEAQLIRDSVRANIALSLPQASLEQIRQAAKAAQIDDYIMSLPRGYDTIIGEETHLSGGQAARIAIARALIMDAPILILDEATAMADPESESRIQEALTTLVRGRTVVVVAHRLASIRGADQIVVMDNGSISAQGKHEDLLKNNHYQMLLKLSGCKEIEA
ncbi:ABC transporter ATP-binding protein [Arcanobacterium ihumii]|uniref:ABC transporter ATP-binding protein n=1 Tax=Arcanobacterium ihumii TaxID=2138162 RepID=UPI001F330943|nr:ABC transporter ATP-binding protein [Arcanobacterium ihumii]